MDVEAVSALCRFARDAAALLLWGSSFYLVVLVPLELRPTLVKRCARLRRVAVATLAVAMPALLPVQAAFLGGGWPDALDPGTLRALLLETTIGTAWQAQTATTMLLLLASAAPRMPQAAATLLGSALLLASLALTGHAAMHEGWLGALHRVTTLLHLLAAGFWLGGLVPLLRTLAFLRDPMRHAAAITALRRFSTVGHGAVSLVIATGIANTALVLGRWPTDWASPYQRLLGAKIGVVMAMTALAVVNRYLFVPRLALAPVASLRSIRRITLVEVALGLGAVALVAVFGQLEPT